MGGNAAMCGLLSARCWAGWKGDCRIQPPVGGHICTVHDAAWHSCGGQTMGGCTRLACDSLWKGQIGTVIHRQIYLLSAVELRFAGNCRMQSVVICECSMCRPAAACTHVRT